MTKLIDAGCSASNNAAAYVRATYCIPMDEVIAHRVEKEFNCKLKYFADDDTTDPWLVPAFIEFETDADATAFLLKWS